MPFPELTTERLQLKQITDKDLAVMHFLRSDTIVNQFIKRKVQSLEETKAFIEKTSKELITGKSIQWGICFNNQTDIIGTVCFWNFSEDGKTTELGYSLIPDVQNQGIMSETVKCVLDYGFNRLQLDLIEAYTDRRNEPSINMLLKHDFKWIESEKDADNENNVVYRLYRKI